MTHEKIVGFCEPNKCKVDITNSLAPTGSILSFAGSSAPSGWLICNGQAVSRTEYADLFAVIGTTYGTGNGSTTFNVPNLVNKTVRGSNSLGKTGGSDTVTLSTSNMPAHTHTGTTSSAGAHTHNTNMSSKYKSSSAGVLLPGSTAGDSTLMIYTDSSGAHTHTFTTSSAGSGSAVTITNPYVMLHYIIKT